MEQGLRCLYLEQTCRRSLRIQFALFYRSIRKYRSVKVSGQCRLAQRAEQGHEPLRGGPCDDANYQSQRVCIDGFCRKRKPVAHLGKSKESISRIPKCRRSPQCSSDEPGRLSDHDDAQSLRLGNLKTSFDDFAKLRCATGVLALEVRHDLKISLTENAVENLDPWDEVSRRQHVVGDVCAIRGKVSHCATDREKLAEAAGAVCKATAERAQSQTERGF